MTDLQLQAHKHNGECKKPDLCSKEENTQEIMPGGQGGATVTGREHRASRCMLFLDLDAKYESVPSVRSQQAVYQAPCTLLQVYLSLRNTFTKYYTIHSRK